MNDASTSIVPAPAPKKKNYAWIGYFVFLVVASVGVAGLMIWYNNHIQLTREQLKIAKDLWHEKGPHDYKMVYTKRLKTNTNVDTFVVTVRAGVVEEVLMNGKPLEPEQRIYYSMEQLFNQISRFMDIDQKPNQPPVYVTADFSEKTGSLLRYVRRVMGTEQQIDLHVRVEELEK